LSAQSYACPFASFAYFLFPTRFGPIPTLLPPLYKLLPEEHGHDVLLLMHRQNQFGSMAFEQILTATVQAVLLEGGTIPLRKFFSSVFTGTLTMLQF
jgi:hypothetical protein